VDCCQSPYVIVGPKAIGRLVKSPGNRFQIIRAWPVADSDGARVDECAHGTRKDHPNRIGDVAKIYLWLCVFNDMAERFTKPRRVMGSCNALWMGDATLR
jgi:hypothetical protein